MVFPTRNQLLFTTARSTASVHFPVSLPQGFLPDKDSPTSCRLKTVPSRRLENSVPQSPLLAPDILIPFASDCSRGVPSRPQIGPSLRLSQSSAARLLAITGLRVTPWVA